MSQYYSVESLKKMNYRGSDASLIESLFEYGFAYSYDDPKSDGDLRIIYRVDFKKFDWADFKKTTNVLRDFDWVDFTEVEREIDAENCGGIETLPLWEQIKVLLDRYGYQNIFGTSYCGFDLVDPNDF